MLFDRESGKIVPQGPTQPTQEEFKLQDFMTKGPDGQFRVSRQLPMVSKIGIPVDNGAPAEAYSGPGSTLGKAVSDWEPIGGADVYNLRRLRVTSLGKFDGGGFGV